MVARYAGAHYIFPDVRAVARSRDDVVQRQLLGLYATVLAGEPVSIKYRLPGQASPHHGALDHVEEPDYRWRRECFGDAMDESHAICDKLSLAVPHQHECPSYCADVERLVVLV